MTLCNKSMPQNENYALINLNEWDPKVFTKDPYTLQYRYANLHEGLITQVICLECDTLNSFCIFCFQVLFDITQFVIHIVPVTFCYIVKIGIDTVPLSIWNEVKIYHSMIFNFIKYTSLCLFTIEVIMWSFHFYVMFPFSITLLISISC